MLSVRKPLFIFGNRTRNASISETLQIICCKAKYIIISFDKFVSVIENEMSRKAYSS